MITSTCEVLYKLRMEAGMTQEEVAEAIGVSRVTYTRYENGSSKLDAAALIKLAKLFNVTGEYIMSAELPDDVNDEEYELLMGVRRLNEEGKARLKEQLDFLLKSPKYKKEIYSASGM